MNLESPLNRILVLIISLLLSIETHALYSVMETGEILREGQFRASIENQFITDEDSGINLMGRFDTWYNEESNVRAVVGLGTTDLYLGGFFKWIPYPDLDSQPAMGFTAGVIYAKYDTDFEDIDELSIRIHPIISKKFQSRIGQLTPYGSLPLGIASREGSTEFPFQAVLGTEWHPEYFKHITFVSELGFNISKAFTYFSIGMQINWDSENGIKFY